MHHMVQTDRGGGGPFIRVTWDDGVMMTSYSRGYKVARRLLFTFNTELSLRELNYPDEMNPDDELADIDTISDIRLSGLACFRYLIARDVSFSLKNIKNIVRHKENFMKSVEQWKEIELYQSRNLFDMFLSMTSSLECHTHGVSLHHPVLVD